MNVVLWRGDYTLDLIPQSTYSTEASYTLNSTNDHVISDHELSRIYLSTQMNVVLWRLHVRLNSSVSHIMKSLSRINRGLESNFLNTLKPMKIYTALHCRMQSAIRENRDPRLIILNRCFSAPDTYI